MNMIVESISGVTLESQRYSDRAQTDLLTDIFATGDSLAIKQAVGIVAKSRGVEIPLWCKDNGEPGIPDLCNAISSFGFRVIVLPKINARCNGVTLETTESSKKSIRSKR